MWYTSWDGLTQFFCIFSLLWAPKKCLVCFKEQVREIVVVIQNGIWHGGAYSYKDNGTLYIGHGKGGWRKGWCVKPRTKPSEKQPLLMSENLSIPHLPILWFCWISVGFCFIMGGQIRLVSVVHVLQYRWAQFETFQQMGVPVVVFARPSQTLLIPCLICLVA